MVVVAGLTTKALTEELLRLTEELLRLKEELKLAAELAEKELVTRFGFCLESAENVTFPFHSEYKAIHN